MTMNLRLLIIVLLVSGLQGLVAPVRSAEAFVTTAGGETITWNFQGIPDASFLIPAEPCYYKADTNYWVCEYGIIDPPYVTPVNFSASITPTKGSFPSLGLYYSGATDYPYNLIKEVQNVSLATMTNAASFYIPASARKFRLLYSSNGSGTGETNIQINVSIANYDPSRANLLGGKEINPDTEYCDERGQPGEPRIRKFNNRKGAGPGKCSRMGLPTYLVNTASLSLVLSDTDFTYKGLGPAVDMTRTYNSNAPAPVQGDPRTDMFGNGWSFTYEGSVTETCLGASVTLGSGASLFFSGTLCPSPTPSSVLTPPPGNFDSLTYRYDESRQIYYWLYQNKKDRLRYRYEHVAGMYRLVSIADRNGLEVRITRNTDGTIQKVSDAAGRSTSFTYVNQRCTVMTTPNGKSATFGYDAAGNLIKTVDLAGNMTTYLYDAQNYLVSMTLGDKVTRFAYDASITPKRISSVTNALGHVQTYQRTGFNETTVADAANNLSVYNANDAGQTERTRDANGGSAGLKAFSAGLLTNYQSPGGWTRSFSYDPRGNILTSTRSSSYGDGITSFSYDANDNLVGRTDPANSAWVWRYEYDAQSNRTKVIRPSGFATVLGYSRGQVTSVTDAKGKTSVFAYDSYGNNVSDRDPLGNLTTRTYDNIGNLLAETDPAGNTTSFQYDANSRLTRVTHPDNTYRSFQYDCCSLTGITDENGHKTTIATNKLLQPLSITDPLGHVLSYTYDATGSVVRITRPDLSVISITPDALHRPSVITDAMGGSRTVSYDGDWNIASLTDERNNTTDFYYDHGRPAVVYEPQSWAAPRNMMITKWDNAGRLLNWINARFGGLTFEYTPDGQVASKRSYYPDAPIASFSYDSVGNMVQMSDLSGVTSFGYDAAGRNTSITYPTAKLLQATYTSTGRIASLSYPNGMVAGYSYDTRGRVKAMSFGGQSITFTYDAVGNLLSETRSNGTSSNYSYDARNLVTEISHTKGAKVYFQATYSRDAMGNVTSESGIQPLTPQVSPLARTASYNQANQVSSWNGDSYSYDPDGNLTGISGSRSFSAAYDQENQLVSMTRDGVTTTFTYNGRGQRVKAVRGSAVTNYHYDITGRMLFQTDGAGAITASYFYSGERLVAMATSDRYYFYHYDKTGNTIALTDTSGNVAVAYAYLPYGENLRVPAVGVANPFTYVGAYGVMDDGGGIYHMTTRAYDAQTGKFLQKDRIGFAGGSNLYAYAGDNPLLKVDPRGTNPLLITGALLLYGAYQGYRCINDMLAVGDNGRREAQAYADRMTLSGVENGGYDARDRYGEVLSSSGERLAGDAFNLEMTIYTTSAPTSSAIEAAGEVTETLLQEAGSPDPTSVNVPGMEE